jgi:hypothetical protein
MRNMSGRLTAPLMMAACSGELPHLHVHCCYRRYYGFQRELLLGQGSTCMQAISSTERAEQVTHLPAEVKADCAPSCSLPLPSLPPRFNFVTGAFLTQMLKHAEYFYFASRRYVTLTWQPIQGQGNYKYRRS